MREYIRGGQLTIDLSEVGDVMSRSAVDHLRQARLGTQTSEHLSHAAADMQNAYFFYEASTCRGPSRTLRITFDAKNLGDSRGKAGDSAAVVAALRLSTHDSHDVVRLWLDRVARQVAEHTRDLMYRYQNARWTSLGYVDEWAWVSMRLRNHIDAYLTLEAALLPPELVRERPLYFRPINTLTATQIRRTRGCGWNVIDHVLAYRLTGEETVWTLAGPRRGIAAAPAPGPLAAL